MNGLKKNNKQSLLRYGFQNTFTNRFLLSKKGPRFFLMKKKTTKKNA